MGFTNAAASLGAMFSTPAPFTVGGNTILSTSGDGTCGGWSGGWNKGGNARRWQDDCWQRRRRGSLFELNESAIMALCIRPMALLDVNTRFDVEGSTLTTATNRPWSP